MTFAELQTLKSEIVDEQLKWIEDVKGISDPELLKAYRAGMVEGMERIVNSLITRKAFALEVKP